jgi:hypothetical protein
MSSTLHFKFFLFASIVFASFSANSTPIEIDFSQTPSYSSQHQIVPMLSYDELLITGSNDISINRYRNGLGVVGGIYDTHIDSSEWLMFEFISGSAQNVVYSPWTYGSNTTQLVEAFGLSGGSLGTVEFAGITSPHLFNVSDSFGGQLLSGFKLQITDGLFNFKSISFDKVSQVPEPSSFVLLLGSIVFLLFSRRRATKF